jgi:hypothetical protein
VKARPFHVSTYGVSPDLQRVHPAFKTLNRGDLSRQRLLDLLEKYRAIETDWSPKASHVTIETASGRFIVRAPEKKLTLAAVTETPDAAVAPPAAVAVPTTAPEVPLTAAEIVERLGAPPVISFARPAPPPVPRWQRITATVLLTVGFALIAYTLNSMFAPAGRKPASDITLVTDPADLKKRMSDVAGVFATGRQAGDRQLTISADGLLVFAEIGPRQALGNATETFRLGRRGNRTCLVTTSGGVIEALDFNTLVYFGDAYRRMK